MHTNALRTVYTHHTSTHILRKFTYRIQSRCENFEISQVTQRNIWHPDRSRPPTIFFDVSCEWVQKTECCSVTTSHGSVNTYVQMRCNPSHWPSGRRLCSVTRRENQIALSLHTNCDLGSRARPTKSDETQRHLYQRSPFPPTDRIGPEGRYTYKYSSYNNSSASHAINRLTSDQIRSISLSRAVPWIYSFYIESGTKIIWEKVTIHPARERKTVQVRPLQVPYNGNVGKRETVSPMLVASVQSSLFLLLPYSNTAIDIS